MESTVSERIGGKQGSDGQLLNRGSSARDTQGTRVSFGEAGFL
jgi:hypothetical protein